MSQRKLDEFRALVRAAHDAIDAYAEDRISGKNEWFIRGLDHAIKERINELITFSAAKSDSEDA